MPKFLYIYHGGTMPETEEEQARELAAWMEWIDGLGAKMIDEGNPVLASQTVTSDGVSEDGGPNPVAGYGMVEAVNYAEATDMAKGCPVVAQGGSVEVAEIYEL